MERVKLFIEANGIEEGRKVAVLPKADHNSGTLSLLQTKPGSRRICRSVHSGAEETSKRHCEDRFVCGLHSKAMKDLTLATALETALGMEAAAKEVTELQASSRTAAGTTTVKGDVLKVTHYSAY